MEIILSQSSWDYIQQIMPSVTEVVEGHAVPVLPSGNDLRPNTGRLCVFLPEEVAGQIIDALTDVLCAQGLKADSEPNSLGLYIENLIDVLSTELYSKEITL